MTRWKGLIAALAVLALAGCGLSGAAARSNAGGPVEVVAAENFWGSIAAQVGGDRVHVTSVIVNPDSDPHEYEATPRDARAMAEAGYVILNGAGYDPWARKLLDANPEAGRQVLDVGDLLGKKAGDNPHFWYSPGYVTEVADRIATDLQEIDAADAAYFGQQAGQFKAAGLKDYNDTLGAIRARYGGVAVGATESVFSYLAEAAGLRLITPRGYMKAIGEGGDPSAVDRATVQQQVAGRQVRVLVFNSQNTTPDVNAVVGQARARGIPVTSVTETLTPAGATFQDWQTRQLRALLQALGG